MYDDGLGGWMATRRREDAREGRADLRRGSIDDATASSPTAPIGWRACSGRRGIRPGRPGRVHGGEQPRVRRRRCSAATQVGAVFVPINTRLAPPEIAHVISDSGARLLIHEPDFVARVAPRSPHRRR